MIKSIGFVFVLAAFAQAADSPANMAPDSAQRRREYRDFSMGHDGDPSRGAELFKDEQRAACAKCHGQALTGVVPDTPGLLG